MSKSLKTSHALVRTVFINSRETYYHSHNTFIVIGNKGDTHN